MCTKNIFGDSVLLQMNNNIGTKLLKLEDEYCTHRLCGSLHTLVVHGRYKQSLSSVAISVGVLGPRSALALPLRHPRARVPGSSPVSACPSSDTSSLPCNIKVNSCRYFYTNTRRAVVMEQFQSKPRPIALWR